MTTLWERTQQRIRRRKKSTKPKSKPKLQPFSKRVSKPVQEARPAHHSPEQMAKARAAKAAKALQNVADTIPPISEFTTSPRWLGIEPRGAQLAILKSIFGEPLDDGELQQFRVIAERDDPRKRQVNVTIAGGAKGGKTGFVIAPALLYVAVFGDHKPAPGEKIRVALVAQDKDGADVAFEYMTAYVQDSPELKRRLVKVGRRGLVLKNVHGHDVVVRTFPCTLKAARAYSFAAAALDECAFYKFNEGSANPDIEIETSVRRGMISRGGDRLLIKASTPYARDGILHRDVKEHYGREDAPVLVLKAPSSVMNPDITEARIAEEAQVMDAARVEREFRAEFVDSATAWLPGDLVDAAVDLGITERPPRQGVRYVMGLDPSGGGKCGFAMTVGHAEDRNGTRMFIQDVVRVWMKPKSGELDVAAIVAEVARIGRQYGLRQGYSDRYAGVWVPSRFSEAGFTVLDPKVKRKDETELYLHKSDAFRECEPLFRTKCSRLLDDPIQTRELRCLEARPQQGGKVQVGKPPARDQSDDVINSCCLAAAMATVARKVRPWGGDANKLLASGGPASRFFDPPVERAKPGEEASACCGAKIDRGFYADGICSHCSRRRPGVLAPGAQPSRATERSISDADIDGPPRRASRGVATDHMGRVGGQCAWITGAYGWRRF